MYVIFGASGNAGFATAAALRHAGRAVRAVVRDTRHSARLAALGCEVALADLTDLASVAAAMRGAQAVQMLCPVPVADAHPEATMRKMIDIAAEALRTDPPETVLALSDYGAELDANTGITRLFHYLEEQLKPIADRLILLRSAEHMQNWRRTIPAALASGVLPSFHHPLNKRFPTVAAQDVGTASAQLLLDAARGNGTRVVNIEGPRRISATYVADVLAEIGGQEVLARELPRDQWTPTLLRAGLSARHAQLITDLYDVHNAGKIDVEFGLHERRFGKTELIEVFAPIVASLRTEARLQGA
ncbi:NmrA family NAD(P)-binding protein [Paraburkholderia silviterrae]|uniref:NmrA family transcriptional regulator n=1 Tax=Paraburkholderia silviterrae TaxID=2528715 RepID=A0A4R5M9K0_9BURK|nr:NmrA family NAD(P)-binding protein [Paraburkholderia silviterrae]TDG23299.1 NmrA family transcriptional regulator [Paraburkholderia silviterrae]